MGMKMKRSNKKSKKHKHIEESDSEEQNLDGNENTEYDIEASDDEVDEAPSKWYDEFPYVKLLRQEIDPNDGEALRNEAEMVLQEETTNYKNLLAECKKSETKWMMTMAKSGTSTDKVAALALMVQESPVHNVSALSSLVSLAKVSKKHQFIVVLETVTELFLTDLLRPSKKLRVFSKQPLAHLADLCENDNKLRRKRLCYWLFEDKLKGIYEQFVLLLNTAAHDSVQNNREKAIGSMLKLLLENREQEKVLINNLVNKLGDPVHKVASRVVYGLEKVVQQYPKLKVTILDEVEKMLFRPRIAKRAQYYGICFLSQFRLASSDRDVCKRLIMLYFSFFKACVKTGDIDSKLMGALLVGVNRAYPYARGNKKETVIPLEHIDTMYKVVHFAPFKISLQALALLLQVTNNDRYYNALYKKLFDKELPQTSHQAIWINLLLKSIRKDSNINRKKSFIKRILQVSLYFPVPLLCGTLIMLSQVMKYMPGIECNLDFSIETADKVSEVIPSSKKFEEIPSDLKKFEDDSDEEKYFDVKTDEDVNDERTYDEPPAPVASSWFHRDLAAPSVTIIPTEAKYKEPTQYDPTHRNPAFAGGNKAIFVELALLAKHFHPTVALFARKIINGERINYSGDPLKDFTTLHFLERFSFKNPKRSRSDKGEDKEELFRAVGSQRKHYNPTGMRALPVQSDLYLKQSESAVPVDELFLYKYLKNKKSRDSEATAKRKRPNEDSDVSDAESVGSVEFNDYLDTLMVGKKGAKSLNFAEDVESSKKNVKKTKEDENEDESDEEDSIDNTDEEDEIANEMSDGSNEESSDDDENEEDDENNSIDDYEGENEEANSDLNLSESEEDEEESKLPLQKALRRRIAKDFGDMAVPVEKFSEMLEEAGQKKSGGSSDVFNRENASQKQLKWEASKVKQRWRTKTKPKWKGNK